MIDGMDILAGSAKVTLLPLKSSLTGTMRTFREQFIGNVELEKCEFPTELVIAYSRSGESIFSDVDRVAKIEPPEQLMEDCSDIPATLLRIYMPPLRGSRQASIQR